MTPMDTEKGEKQKRSEESKKIHKKQKINKTSRAGGLTNDDCNLIIDRIEEVSNESCKHIDGHNTDLVRGIINLLQTLCVMIK